MKFRWTRKELNEATVHELIRVLITEREHGLNPHSPLGKRLQHLHKWLEANKWKLNHIPIEFKKV